MASRSGSQVQTVSDTVSYLLLGTTPPVDPANIPKPIWPPDAFAVAAALLKQSGAYTEILNQWPPKPFTTLEEWHETAVAIRTQWRKRFNSHATTLPPRVAKWWKILLDAWLVPLSGVAEDPDLVTALLGIVAAADQTCHGVGVLDAAQDYFDDYAIGLLTLRNTLCEQIDPSRAVVLPKMHNPLSGMTLRSLTHNLAFWDRSEVTPTWNQLVELPELDGGLNALLLPWPLVVHPHALHETDSVGAKMPDTFGLFTYDMSDGPIDVRRIRMLLSEAERLVGEIHAVIFPELSLSERDFQRVLRVVGDRLVVAGIGTPATPDRLGRNDVAIGVSSSSRGTYRQSKHHRWRLDRSQLEQYGVSMRFGARSSWWEAISLSPRRCSFFSVNKWFTFCVLICEDLARQDPVAELVRCVGPNLVIALLMDGPQIPDRWSARYATVLAEDPRSSVLTISSAGLVDLARSQYGGGPRSIGLWKDAISGGARQIVLEPGAEGIVLTMQSEMQTEWTADGRHDDGTTGYLRLGRDPPGVPPGNGPAREWVLSRVVRRKAPQMPKQRISVPSIELTDMSRLRVIAHLEASGASTMARDIAQTIEAKSARRVADLLTKSGKATDKSSKKLADDLLSVSRAYVKRRSNGGAKLRAATFGLNAIERPRPTRSLSS